MALNIKEKALEAIKDMSEDKLPDIIELDEIYTQIKKNSMSGEFPYGLLILGGEVRLLPLSKAREATNKIESGRS